jgi:hypothetical protein
MTHRGHVKNGVVVLDDPKALPDGTRVSVTLRKRMTKTTKRKKTLGRPKK